MTPAERIAADIAELEGFDFDAAFETGEGLTDRSSVRSGMESANTGSEPGTSGPVSPPLPSWAVERELRKPKQQQSIAERVPNSCPCKPTKRPLVAADLCVHQVKLTFMANYPAPVSAGTMHSMFFFVAGERDMAEVQSVIEANREQWTAEAEFNRYWLSDAGHRETLFAIGFADPDRHYDEFYGESARQREMAKHHAE